MNFDRYLSRSYNLRDYNCAHFVAEVWADCFSQDISEYIAHIYAPISKRTVDISKLRQFKREENPSSLTTPYITLMNSGAREIHVGIYYNGRVLHITSSGVRYELLETLKPLFKKVSFYYVKSNDCL